MRVRLLAISGVARTSLMLGHSMGTLCLNSARSAEVFRGFLGHALPQPPRSVLRPYCSAVYVTLIYGKLAHTVSVRDP